jgi:prepilin signal peptidase PulO-like enzyme (type II secretory pathway)|tara:strand:- start:369939 stop:370472 length:534 start_codon:yes stop_codon:yes gene_type:complete
MGRMLRLAGSHVILYAATALVLVVPLSPLALGLGAVLIWASVVDVQTFEIPDMASALVFLFALYDVLFLHSVGFPWWDRLAGAVFWPAIFWGIAAGYKSLRGAMGLGFGDVKLMVGIGLFCGLSDTTYVVLGASLSAVILLAISRAISSWRRTKTPVGIAFGPFLTFAAWCVFLLEI